MGHRGKAFFNKAALSFLLMGVLGLSGCAMTPEQREALNPASTKVEQGHGLVVLRVVKNVAQSPLALTAVTLKLRAVPDGKSYSLVSKSQPGSSTALFIESLPPGRYQPIKLSISVRTGELYTSLEEMVGEFQVEQGKISDLGAFAMVFTEVGIVDATYRIAHIPSPKDTDATLMSVPVAALSSVSSLDMLRISPPIDPVANKATLAFGRTYASLTNQSTLINGQPVAFGRTLGVASFWDPSSERWSHVDTGSSFPIGGILLDRDGSQLFGLQEGLLAENKNGAISYLPLPRLSSTVHFLGRKGSGEYLAVVEDRNAWIVLSTSDPRTGTWKELRHFPIERKVAFPNIQINTWLTRDRLVLVATEIGWSMTITVHSLNFATGTWDSFVADVPSAALTEFNVFQNGTIVAVGGSAYSRVLYKSTDWGKTWLPKPQENWSMAFLYKDENRFYAQRLDKVWGVGPGESSLWRSDDAGDTWRRLGDLPKHVTKIYALPKPNWLLLTTMAGQIYISNDDGKSWTPQKF